jgi:hypothetical protein
VRLVLSKPSTTSTSGRWSCSLRCAGCVGRRHVRFAHVIVGTPLRSSVERLPAVFAGSGRDRPRSRFPSVDVRVQGVSLPSTPRRHRPSIPPGTATAPHASPADSFGGRAGPASLLPRTVPAGGRLGVARQRARATLTATSCAVHPSKQAPGGMKGRGPVAACVARTNVSATGRANGEREARPQGAPRCDERGAGGRAKRDLPRASGDCEGRPAGGPRECERRQRGATSGSASDRRTATAGSRDLEGAVSRREPRAQRPREQASREPSGVAEHALRERNEGILLSDRERAEELRGGGVFSGRFICVWERAEGFRGYYVLLAASRGRSITPASGAFPSAHGTVASVNQRLCMGAPNRRTIRTR